MKKHFDCGHTGKGKYCHRCDQAAALVVQSKEEKDAGKLTAMKAAAEKLYAVPKKAGQVMMPSDPVPA
jgi:hypothetical protein